MTVSLADIEAAERRLAGQVLDTPCVESRTLGQIVGCRVFLKFENLQFTASFKERGALNRLVSLAEAAITPRGGAPDSTSAHSLFSAPRSLNEAVNCRFSNFR